MLLAIRAQAAFALMIIAALMAIGVMPVAAQTLKGGVASETSRELFTAKQSATLVTP